MGRADVARSMHVPLRIEPERGQVAEHAVESSSSESCAVLHEDVARSYLANDPSELLPETRALAVDPCALACGRDVLTGKTSHDEIHVASPGHSVEGADVGPNRRRIQATRFHASRQNRDGVSVPLHVTDRASTSNSSSDGQVEPSVTGE